ncbi:hypothetical protein N9Q76_02630 [Flavobacteriales bacterium]|nr:hypothetical protein [Flavobacteriales bacterium]
MNKRLVQLFILIIFCQFSLAQSGGYLGNHHNFGVEVSYQPIYEPKSLSSFNLRPSYEIALAKNFSFIGDVGLKHFSRGVDQVAKGTVGTVQEGSFLFFTNSVTQTAIENEEPKYYISGFDINFKLRFYSYKKKGKIAPIGTYTSLVIGTPQYKTFYKNDEVGGSSYLTGGLEFGAQKIQLGFVTVDYGLRSSIPLYSTDFGFIGNILLLDSVLPSDMYSTLSPLFNVYFKIGYLAW